MTDMQIPHSRSSEEALIGSALMNPESLREVQDIVAIPDFYIHTNRLAWKALVTVYNRGDSVDIVTISEELGDTVSFTYLMELVNKVPSSLHGKTYATKVRDTAKLRKGLEIASKIAKDAYKSEPDINEMVADATKALNELSTVDDTGKPLFKVISDAADLILERIEMRNRGEEVEIGYQTGIGYIDRNFKGLKKGWLVYLAGSPNVGKTKMATQLSAVLARQGAGCYIALEGDEQATAYRLLEGKLGASATDIEFGKVDPSAVIAAIGEFEELDYDFFYTPRLSVYELRAYVAKQKAERDIGWIVIDYVSLLTIPGVSDRNEKDEAMSAELRRITGEFNILTIGLDSIVKSGANKILSLDDIAGRFSKQHDSDITFGYSDYRAIKGLTPEIDDYERKRNCRLLGVLKDRHRGNKGKIMALEQENGLVTDFVEDRSKPYI